MSIEQAFQFSREMGVTHAEFFKSLPAAIEYRDYSVAGSLVTIAFEGRQVEITLGVQQVRRIALLEIPYVAVDFCFKDFSEEQMNTFMDRFNLYFRRGGG